MPFIAAIKNADPNDPKGNYTKASAELTGMIPGTQSTDIFSMLKRLTTGPITKGFQDHIKLLEDYLKKYPKPTDQELDAATQEGDYHKLMDLLDKHDAGSQMEEELARFKNMEPMVTAKEPPTPLTDAISDRYDEGSNAFKDLFTARVPHQDLPPNSGRMMKIDMSFLPKGALRSAALVHSSTDPSQDPMQRNPPGTPTEISQSPTDEDGTPVPSKVGGDNQMDDGSDSDPFMTSLLKYATLGLPIDNDFIAMIKSTKRLK